MEDKKKQEMHREPSFPKLGSNSIENLMLLVDDCNKECDKRKKMNIQIKQDRSLLLLEGYIFYDDCEKLKCDTCPINVRKVSLEKNIINLRNWGV